MSIELDQMFLIIQEGLIDIKKIMYVKLCSPLPKTYTLHYVDSTEMNISEKSYNKIVDFLERNSVPM